MNAASMIIPDSVAMVHFRDSSMLRSISSTTLMPITKISSGAMACQSMAGDVHSDAWANRAASISRCLR